MIEVRIADPGDSRNIQMHFVLLELISAIIVFEAIRIFFRHPSKFENTFFSPESIYK